MYRNMMEGLVKLSPDYGNGGSAADVQIEGTSAGTVPEGTDTGAQVDTGAVSSKEQTTTTTPTEAEKEVQSPAWMAQLPKELRNDPELAKHRTMGEAIKYLKAQSEGKVEDPGVQSESAPAEAGETVPVKYENFAVNLSEENDPFGDISTGLVSELQTLGVPQEKAEAFIKKLDGLQNDATKKFVDSSMKYTEDICKKNWGKDYNAKRTLMAKGYQALGDVDGSLQKSLDKDGASLSPAMWEVMARVGKMVSEDKAVGSQKGSGIQERDPNCPVVYKY